MTNVRSVRPRWDEIVTRFNKKMNRKIEPTVDVNQLNRVVHAINESVTTLIKTTDSLRIDFDSHVDHVAELENEFRHEVHDLQSDNDHSDIDEKLENSYVFSDLDRSVDSLTEKVEDLETIDPDELRELQGQVQTIIQVVKSIGDGIQSETMYL